MVMTTREAVLMTISECHAVGIEAFLKAHGYKDSKKYHISHGGREYPSKAILGVAAGKKASEFSGGAAHAVKVLKRLGFAVISKVGELASKMIAFASTLVIPFAPLVVPALPVEPTEVYFSGINHPDEVRGLEAIDADICVAANEMPRSLEAALKTLDGTDIRVMVDSGAFSEVAFNAKDAPPEVVKLITDDEWKRRLDLYGRLAVSLPDSLGVIAPDQVGSQDVTLERMARYGDQIRSLYVAGTRILAPVQRGKLSQADFYVQACHVLGFKAVPAIPCRKKATSPEELRAFVEQIRPPMIHLLGMGLGNPHIVEYLKACAVVDGIQVTMDSNVLRAHVGRVSGLGRYTYAQDIARSKMPDHVKALGIVIAFGGFSKPATVAELPMFLGIDGTLDARIARVLSGKQKWI